MAAVPQRWFSTAAVTFRTLGTNNILHGSLQGAASGGGLATVASYASGAVGVRLLQPDATNSTAGAVPGVGAAPSGYGWRADGTAGSLSTAYAYNADSGNGQAFQKRYPTTTTGTWTWVVSTVTAPVAQATGVAAALTIVVYAIDASGAARELFRTAATTISAAAAETNTTITATPGSVVLNADEIFQYEMWVNVTAGPTIAGAYTLAFRDGVAGAALTQPSIQPGTAMVANITAAGMSATSSALTSVSKLPNKLLTVASATNTTPGPKQITHGMTVTTPTTTAVTKLVGKRLSVTSPTVTKGTVQLPFSAVPSGGGAGVAPGGAFINYYSHKPNDLPTQTILALFRAKKITFSEMVALLGDR